MLKVCSCGYMTSNPIAFTTHKRDAHGIKEKSKIPTFVKENRSNPTPSERMIMKILDSLGKKYVFQQPFKTPEDWKPKFYIADFDVEHKFNGKRFKFIIEADGIHHTKDMEQLMHDVHRTTFLRKHRKRVVRFQDHEILNDTNRIRKKILNICRHMERRYIKKALKRAGTISGLTEGGNSKGVLRDGYVNVAPIRA